MQPFISHLSSADICEDIIVNTHDFRNILLFEDFNLPDYDCTSSSHITNNGAVHLLKIIAVLSSLTQINKISNLRRLTLDFVFQLLKML